jgi:hypothetical protein
MNNQVVKHDALQAITGYKRTPDILKCLKAQGIQCFVGKKRNMDYYWTDGKSWYNI